MQGKIAIVGASCLFPGANSLEEFWENLYSNKDNITTGLPLDFDTDPNLILDETIGVQDKTNAIKGGFIRDFKFETSGFKTYSKEQLQNFDREYQWSLTVAKNALKQIQLTQKELESANIGVIMGNVSFPSQTSNKVFNGIYNQLIENKIGLSNNFIFEKDSLQNQIDKTASGIIKTALGLTGKNYDIDAACAGSLYAIKMACDELNLGHSNIMLAGAVCASDTTFINTGFTIFHAISPQNGIYEPLGQGSQGLAAGQGAAMLVLKRLEVAQNNGDTILGVIAGIGLSNDGKGKFVLNPNSKGQQMAYKLAYDQNGLDFKNTQYIECHATGTTVGDATELESIENYFVKNENNLLIGAVKNNIGHLLSASGMAAIFKVLGSFKNNIIPSTINVQKPLLYSNGDTINLVQSHYKWENKHKQVGVNAFGFGGTNAHLVLENYVKPHKIANIQKNNKIPSVTLSIIGMDVQMGQIKGLEHFEMVLNSAQQCIKELPENRWKGFQQEFGKTEYEIPKGNFLDTIELDLLRFKILPSEFSYVEPQQLISLKAIDGALKKANVKEGGNTAIIVAMKTDKNLHQFCGRWQVEKSLINKFNLNSNKNNDLLIASLKDYIKLIPKDQGPNHHTSIVGNLIASKIANVWNFNGPAFTITSENDAVAEALLIAQNLLQLNTASTVVIGAVNLAGGFEEMLINSQQNNFNNLIFENNIGEGACAIVIKKHTEIEENQRVYANIDAVLLDKKINNNVVELATKNLATKILKNQNLSQIQLGSVIQNIGNCPIVNTMAAIIKGALEIYNKVIFGSPNFDLAQNQQFLLENNFYSIANTKPWLLVNNKEQRKLSILSDFKSIELSENNNNISTFGKPKFKQKLCIIEGNSQEELLQALSILKSSFNEKDTIGTIAYNCFQKLTFKKQFKIAIVAGNKTDLLKEITVFEKNINSSFHTTKDLKTPLGSYFTPTPMGENAPLAFVYPGSATIYNSAIKDLFETFPLAVKLFQEMAKPLPNLKQNLQYLYRNNYSLTNTQDTLSDNAIVMMSLGICFASAYTHLIEHYFKIKPKVACGYSMGECSTMYYALNVWDQAKIPSFENSEIFKSKFTGELTTLANHWQMTTAEAKQNWISVILLVSAHIIQPFIDQEEYLYLTFINSPNEVIVSGKKEKCLALVKKLGLNAIEFPFQNIIHHSFCEVERNSLIEIHKNKMAKKMPDIQFYSSISQNFIDLESNKIAQNSTEVCVNQVNFTTTIKNLYSKGIRYFIEVGPNNTCTNWTGQILSNEPHVAIAVDKKASSVSNNFLAMAAQLISNGKNISIDFLFEEIDNIKVAGTLFKEIVVGQDYKINNNFLDKTAFKNIETMTEVKKTNHIIGENGLKITDFSTQKHLENKTIIFSKKDLETFATGKIADVFGPEYSIIDTYKRRVMLPMYPYLLVSRVTKISATINEYKPSTMQTEYDIPFGSFYSVDGQITTAVCVESGQCDLLLISYLGIDFQNKGEYVYRLLDCTLTFLDDLPLEGQTLRYDISINSFVKNENNLLFFFSYECFVEDRMVLKMDGGCAGFFKDEQLANGAGIVYTNAEINEMKNAQKQHFIPLVKCSKTSFDLSALLLLNQGDFVGCFENDAYFTNGKNPSLRLPNQDIMMIDCITSIDVNGGYYGLGQIIAEKELKPTDWYFPCHFRDDQVLAGSLQAEGGSTLIKFFMLFLGMNKLSEDARFQPVKNIKQKVRCRKQVIPNKDTKLVYKLVIKEIKMVPFPTIIGDLEIISDGNITVHFQNLGVEIREKDNPSYLNKLPYFWEIKNKNAVINEQNLAELALGKLKYALDDDFEKMDYMASSRQPNTSLQKISRVLYVDGKRGDFSKPSHVLAEYDVPINAWYLEQNANKIIPYAIVMEIALQPCGFLGAYLGSTLVFKETEMFFRNLDGQGEYITLNLPNTFGGKTIQNKSTLLSSTTLGDVVIQKYTFELFCDDKLFYKGDSSFGYFTKEALSGQLGLDNGKYVEPWYKSNGLLISQFFRFKLDSLYAKTHLYQNQQSKDYYRLSSHKLDILNSGLMIKDGGMFKKGYIFAQKNIKASDWYFYCHFYQDPVMPGSLGVEAMMQALQVFIIHHKIGNHFENPSFRHCITHKTIWKYRGQILQNVQEMKLELHIKTIEENQNQVKVVADGWLWNDTVRIYEIKDLAILVSNN